MSTSKSQKYKRKNALGNRSDIGWKHGIEVEGSQNKVQCKHCEKIMSGGINRLKHHLARTRKNVEACNKVPDELSDEMALEISKKQKSDVEEILISNISKENKRDSLANKDTSQATSTQFVEKGPRHEACHQIARFFYKNGIPLSCVKTPEFIKMFELVANFGHGFKPPSYNEISGTYLKTEVKDTLDLFEEHKARWKKVGCSIILDIWQVHVTPNNYYCAVWINSSEGTIFFSSHEEPYIDYARDILKEVLEEVGEENVVQVIYNNDHDLMYDEDSIQGNRIFLTPCAAFNIESILDKFVTSYKNDEFVTSDKNDGNIISDAMKIASFIYSKVDLISMLRNFTKGKDLIKASTNKYTTTYWTMSHLYHLRSAFMEMFTSVEWGTSRYTTTRMGNSVQDLILDCNFWRRVRIYLWVASPLTAVHQMINSDEKPTMGFIYEEMNRAKEKIRVNLKNNPTEYDRIRKIIDDTWDVKPLHTAAYYLNPHSHHSSDFKFDAKIKNGLDDCLKGMITDEEERNQIHLQIKDFMKEKILYGMIEEREKQTPDKWWEEYGKEYPELQRFAIRILSLTCSCLVYDGNRDFRRRMVVKPRNSLRERKMNQMVAVMQNLSLRDGCSKRNSLAEGTMNDLPSDDDWILNEDRDVDYFRRLSIFGDITRISCEDDEDFGVSNEMEKDDSNSTDEEEN